MSNKSLRRPLTRDTSSGLPLLLEIMRRLRDRDTGCPWDIEQDFASIAPYTIEEAYEVADAVERGDMDDLRGELGDLLLQTVYHAQIAEEAGHFSFADVVACICTKMIDRHPHVFGDASRDKSAEQQSRDWEEIKSSERTAGGANRKNVLDGVALNLPALTRAIKLQNRAARVGFDWPDASQVVDKIAEEARELNEAKTDLSQAEITEEFGDLTFALANLARHLNIDPEQSLRAANAKFARRFTAIEAKLHEIGKTPEQSDLAEMDRLWNLVKAEETQLTE